MLVCTRVKTNITAALLEPNGQKALA